MCCILLQQRRHFYARCKNIAWRGILGYLASDISGSNYSARYRFAHAGTRNRSDNSLPRAHSLLLPQPISAPRHQPRRCRRQHQPLIGAPLTAPAAAPARRTTNHPGPPPLIPGYRPRTPPRPPHDAIGFPEAWRLRGLDLLVACCRGAALKLIAADVLLEPGGNLAHTRCSSKSPHGSFRRARAHFLCILDGRSCFNYFAYM
jgi:hypothetical protein